MNILKKKCNDTVKVKSKDFWNAVKPFISNKMKGGDSCFTIIDDNEKLISKPEDVCESFNDYFSNVANDIGFNDCLSMFQSMNDINEHYKDHKSIKLIENSHSNTVFFSVFKYQQRLRTQTYKIIGYQ